MEIYIVIRVIKYNNGGLNDFGIEHAFDTAHDADRYAKGKQEQADITPELNKNVSWTVVKTGATLNDLQGNIADIKVILDKLRNL